MAAVAAIALEVAMLISPPMSARMAGALPLYAMYFSFTPDTFAKRSMPM